MHKVLALHRSITKVRPAGIALALALATQPAGMAQAAPAEVRIVAESDLDFGVFMVFGPGSRTVSAQGAVTDSAIVPLEGRTPAPARFAIHYDRGNNDRKAIDIELELVMTAPPPVRVGGVTGSLSSFETNLPAATRIQPGQAVRISIRACRTRVCSQRFQVGGRLDVSRQFGGAHLAIPLPFDVQVISVDRQNPGQGQGPQ